MESIKGTVDKVIFRSAETGFSVLFVKKEDGEPDTLVGIIPEAREGACFEAEGERQGSKYGPQLKVSSYTERQPSDLEGIERYLASGLIKYIGPAFARAIVSRFGKETLDVLDKHPERLYEVKGIGKKRCTSIISSVKEQKVIREVMVWLKRYGLPNGLSGKIYRTYGQQSMEILNKNPYVIDDIEGVGFKTADRVAISMGIGRENDGRIRAGIKYVLETASAEGHTCLPYDEFLSRVTDEEILGVEAQVVDRQLTALVGEGSVVQEDGFVFGKRLWDAERNVADRLSFLASQTVETENVPSVSRLEKATGITYDPAQVRAISTALSNGVTVITGGPGTGKTVTTKAVVTAFEMMGLQVSLTAPTGRAAKRMTEVCGRPATTVHRLLEWQSGPTRNHDFPLDGGALIVDESSMIDISLMDLLLDAVPNGMRVVFVGDVDQLPSVGPGRVLKDIIDSGTVPTVRLKTVFRQAAGSDIVMNAHAVNGGRMPRIGNAPGTDFWFVRREKREDICDAVIELVCNRLPKRFGQDDIQVLCPMRRAHDVIASTELNKALQEKINPGGDSIGHEGRKFRAGDRVMQVRNNYDKGVFNGDIGKVSLVDTEKKTVEVDFDDTKAVYEFGELDELDLAYACTIHKSQGSEYPAVVIPLHRSQYVMLRRNLLYTGITRAKKFCVLVGTEEAIRTACGREDTTTRWSLLKDRLSSAGAIVA